MPALTRFEATRLLSARSLQLSLGAPSLVKAPKHASFLEIAKLEMEKKALPIAVLREYPDGRVERVEAIEFSFF